MRTVCRISTSISTTSSWSNTSSVSVAIVQLTETLPEHFAGVCNRRERRYKKQYGKNGIDNHFGFAQIVAKVDAELLFGHLGSLVKSLWFAPIQRQSITISRIIGK